VLYFVIVQRTVSTPHDSKICTPLDRKEREWQIHLKSAWALKPNADRKDANMTAMAVWNPIKGVMPKKMPKAKPKDICWGVPLIFRNR
jgi:hypothetical protein